MYVSSSLYHRQSVCSPQLLDDGQDVCSMVSLGVSSCLDASDLAQCSASEMGLDASSTFEADITPRIVRHILGIHTLR